MREIRSYGSARGVVGDRYPYRDPPSPPQPRPDPEPFVPGFQLSSAAIAVSRPHSHMPIAFARATV
jgi:hypothetical protein